MEKVGLCNSVLLAILFNLYPVSLQGVTDDLYCGVPLKDRRIIGGIPAEDFQYPWQVALFIGDWFQCGGTLISSLTVLTAAHCVSPGLAMTVGITNGSINVEDSIMIPSAKVIRHPNYDNTLHTYDFAIIILSEPVEFGEGILPICLPDPNKNYDDVMATITGWGYNGDTYDPEYLLKANLSTIGNEECQFIFKQEYPRIYDDITPDMICASSPGKDTCWGDSGGPMVTLEGEGAFYTQIGITSWGYGCAERTPGVYSRVTDQLYWIFSQIEGRTLPAPVSRPTSYCNPA